MNRTKKLILTIATALAAAAYLAIGIYMVMHEPQMVFPRASTHCLSPLPEDIDHRCHRITIRTKDAVDLACWEISPADGPPNRAWVLFFHGNGQNVSDPCDHYRLLLELDLNVLAVEYRGYGGSAGVPTETGLYRDAEACYRQLVQKKRISPQRIILYGYSIGAAVAIDLAAKEKAAGLIAEGAFTSIPDIGQQRYPYLPVQLIAKNRFASKKKINRISIPKLFIHARDDKEVPFRHGQALYRAAVPPKEFLEFDSGGHHALNPINRPAYFRRISAFLSHALTWSKRDGL